MSPFVIWLLGLSFLFGGLDGIGRKKQKNRSVKSNAINTIVGVVLCVLMLVNLSVDYGFEW